MSPVIEIADKKAWLLTIKEPSDFRLPFQQKPYPCLIWANEETSSDFKVELVSKLIEMDCRYIVAAGKECGQWHDAGDVASLESDESYAPPDERFVMTSWHQDETPDEVAFFFALNTSFNDHYFQDFLIVLVGQNRQVESALLDAMRKFFRP